MQSNRDVQNKTGRRMEGEEEGGREGEMEGVGREVN